MLTRTPGPITPDALGAGPDEPASRTRVGRGWQRWSGDRRVQFWTFQLAGWSGLCIVTFLSLTLWYNSVAAVYVQHTVVQAVLGLAISLLMRVAFRSLWSVRPVRRVVVSGTVVVAASLAWTALRIETFTAMTGEAGVWADFGGWYFASLLVMLSWALAYHGIRFYRLMLDERERAGRERLRRLTAERAAQDAQLRMLRYQINPHFLFNTLNSVTALIETDRGKVASEMIGELSRFLRSTLRADGPIRTTLGEEVETLALYLAIERKRFGDRLRVEIDVPDDAAAAALPSLLLQPIVENSVKHAVARSQATTTITVRARRVGDVLRLRIADEAGECRGRTRHAAREGGVGLVNVEERLSAEFGAGYVLRSGPGAGGGWNTSIEVPYAPAPPTRRDREG